VFEAAVCAPVQPRALATSDTRTHHTALIENGTGVDVFVTTAVVVSVSLVGSVAKPVPRRAPVGALRRTGTRGAIFEIGPFSTTR